MRFCSRCGFNLTGVSMVLENNGALPPTQAIRERTCVSRNRMMLESSILAVVGWLVAFTATFWFDAHGPYEGVAKITAMAFFLLGFIGLLRFLYAFMAVRDSQAAAALSQLSNQHLFNNEKAYQALPPQQSIPISDYPSRMNTKEIRPQASVTENTTRLLDQ